MTSVFDREDILFQVVVNHEEQYSIWPDYKAVPEGWRTVAYEAVGPKGGPLVVANFQSKADDHDPLFEQVKALAWKAARRSD